MDTQDAKNIKVGDSLVVIWRYGLSYAGDEYLIFGLTEKSININGSYTGWQPLSDFRWDSFEHKPSNEIPGRVKKFQDGLPTILEGNVMALERQRKFLRKR